MSQEPKSQTIPQDKLWQIPVFLTIVTLVCFPFLLRMPGASRHSWIHDLIIEPLSILGTMTSLVGAGLGFWIAVRAFSLRTVLSGTFSLLVSALWWFVFLRVIGVT